MKNFTNLLITVCCVGCAVNPVQVIGPNGGEAYSMKCSGMGRTLDDCYQKAGELCGKRGYELVSQNSGTVAAPAGNAFIAVPTNHMMIECKDS